MKRQPLTRRSLLEGKTVAHVTLERVPADEEHSRPALVSVTRVLFTDGTVLTLDAQETEFEPRVTGTVWSKP